MISKGLAILFGIFVLAVLALRSNKNKNSVTSTNQAADFDLEEYEADPRDRSWMYAGKDENGKMIMRKSYGKHWKKRTRG